jgi:hypothetical protein
MSGCLDGNREEVEEAALRMEKPKRRAGDPVALPLKTRLD